MQLPDHILRTLASLEAEDRLRTIPRPKHGLVDFSSNDYLGLARKHFDTDPSILGAGGARLLAGTHQEHLDLEAVCAAHFGAEAALLFNSGYQANLGLLSALGQRGETYLYDEACHASIKDGMRLSMAGKFSFRHNDLDDLERLLKKTQGNRYIVVERLYSMDGDWCELKAIEDLAGWYGAWVIVDEAHSTGISSESRVQRAELAGGQTLAVGNERILARMYGFGKAIGRMGAVVVGSQQMIDFLVNRSRAWIYSTAMPAQLAASISAVLMASKEMDAERTRLFELRRCLENALQEECGIQPIVSDSPIYPLIIPGNTHVKAVAARAQNVGYDVRAILSPTVPEGTERLRIVLHAFNTEEEVRGLAKAIGPRDSEPGKSFPFKRWKEL
jgi:8-amino-7-oxononanoate synthase